MTDTPESLHQLLSQMPPRSALVLSARLLEGRTREQCAAHFGVSLPAWDVLFLRAADALGHTEAPPPRPHHEDVARAARLAKALEQQPPADPSVARLQALSAHAAAVKALMAQAEVAHAKSPAATRELWLRRLGVVAVLAATAWFYFRSKP